MGLDFINTFVLFKTVIILGMFTALVACGGGEGDHLDSSSPKSDINGTLSDTAGFSSPTFFEADGVRTDAALDLFSDSLPDIFPVCRSPVRARVTTVAGADPSCVGACDAGFCGEDPVLGLPAPFCYKKCPDGFTDFGSFGCQKSITFRRPDTPRVVGTSCTDPSALFSLNENECHSCDSGYTMVGLTCVENCPSGWTDATGNGVPGLCTEPVSCETCYKLGVPYLCNCTGGSTKGKAVKPVKVDSPVECLDGSTPYAGFCYEDCPDGSSSATEIDGVADPGGPICQKNCPQGMIDAAAYCENKVPRVFPGVRETPCPSESFRELSPPGTDDTGPFTMIIFSDPQMHWAIPTENTDTSDNKYFQDIKTRDALGNALKDSQGNYIVTRQPKGRNCTKDDKVCIQNSQQEAERQVKAMNTVDALGPWPNNPGGRAVDTPKGVIINGDLTQYFHEHEVKAFEKFFVKGSHECPGEHVLQHPLYPGLGNHDYENNLNDCRSAGAYYVVGSPDFEMPEGKDDGWGTDSCARRAADYIKGMVSCNTMENFEDERVESFDLDSLAYSWNIGNYHFIQLNNYPTYTASDIGIKSSMEWLEDDLMRANNAGRKIVINLHDVVADSTAHEFVNLLKAYESRIVAVFSGHTLNPLIGYQGLIGVNDSDDFPFRNNGLPNDDEDGQIDTKIPHFKGGHAGTGTRNHFLVADFSDDYFNVCAVNSINEGIPAWVQSYSSCHLIIYPIPPVLSNFSGDTELLEGESGTYTYTMTADDPAVVTFVDGYPNCGSGIAVTTTADAGVFYCDFLDGPANLTVSLKVENDAESNTVSQQVTVHNVAPTVTLDAASPIDENSSVTLTGTIKDPGVNDSFTADISWGDGSSETFHYQAGTSTFSESHQYLDDNPSGTASDDYTIKVSITDKDGGQGAANTRVTVNNVAPIVVANNTVINENGTATVSGTITDPGTLDLITLVIDWGEGSPESFSYSAGTTAFSESHQYLDDNPTGTASDDYIVTVTASDDDTGTGTTTATVTVNNVAPTVMANGTVIDEDDVATVSGTIIDPGSLDPIALVIDWGEGSPESFSYPPGTTTFSELHQYLDDNPTGTASDGYAINVTASDDDEGVGTTTASNTVDNLAPIALIDATTDEAGHVIGEDVEIVLVGLELELQASFTDVGTLDTHRAAFDWADGTVNESAATSPVMDTHVYWLKGLHAMSVSVTDDDTGMDKVSNTIEVVDAAGACRHVVNNLSECVNDSNQISAENSVLQKAISELEGNNSGEAFNGACDMLEKGNWNAAEVKLGKALTHLKNQDALCSTTNVEISVQRSLLGLAAKSTVIVLTSDAKAVATKSMEYEKIADAETLIEEGDVLFAAGNLVDAVGVYRRVISKLPMN